MDLLIRRASLDDREPILVFKPVLSPDSVLRRIQDTLDQRAAFLLAFRDDTLLGQVVLKFYGMEHAPDYPALEDLYVHPDHRGQGIGTALLLRCEEIARERGFSALQLSVGTENTRARKLYEAVGYVDRGQKPYLGGVYAGVEEWVVDMWKNLVSA